MENKDDMKYVHMIVVEHQQKELVEALRNILWAGLYKLQPKGHLEVREVNRFITEV